MTFPSGRTRRRALRHRARAGRVGGEPRHDRLPPLAVAAPRRRAPGRAPDRHRPAARHRTSREAKRVAAIVREALDELGLRRLAEDVRQPRDPRRVPDRAGMGLPRACAAVRSRSRAKSSGALPDLVTTAWWKEERGEKVFIDYNQNARDRTIASAYSVGRAPDATVSAPGRVGRAPGGRDRGLHHGDHAGALRRARRRPGRDRRRRLRPARAARVGRARGGAGIGEAPYPPNFPKMPGEPPRVQPSRKKKS